LADYLEAYAARFEMPVCTGVRVDGIRTDADRYVVTPGYWQVLRDYSRIAVEHLRQVMTELQIADVQVQVSLYIHSDFEHCTQFNPAPHHEQILHGMLDQLVAWSKAMQSLRQAA
jgi:hypothetical protein